MYFSASRRCKESVLVRGREAAARAVEEMIAPSHAASSYGRSMPSVKCLASPDFNHQCHAKCSRQMIGSPRPIMPFVLRAGNGNCRFCEQMGLDCMNDHTFCFVKSFLCYSLVYFVLHLSCVLGYFPPQSTILRPIKKSRKASARNCP